MRTRKSSYVLTHKRNKTMTNRESKRSWNRLAKNIPTRARKETMPNTKIVGEGSEGIQIHKCNFVTETNWRIK